MEATQATIALSSAEAELYAINTGATEALHIRSLLMELLNEHPQGQHQDPHRLIKWQEHGHKNWNLKKSKTH